jgi:hypothetical protein
MGVTVTNLIAGPADIYIGAFGATEPADSAVNTTPSASVWTDMGGTQDGVKLVVKQEYFELEVDQIVDRVGSRLSKREVTIEANLAEPTLANIANVLNGGTVTASAAFATYDAVNDSSATQPTYKAIIIDGWAPGVSPFRRRIIVRKVLSIDGIKEQEYKKDGQILLPSSFIGHYVSSAIRPFRIIDQLT